MALLLSGPLFWLGESVLLLPLAVLCLMGAHGRLPSALTRRWACALLACCALTALLKVIGYGVEQSLHLRATPDISGHGALSTVFYGGLAIGLGWSRPIRARLVLILAAAALVAAIGAARMALALHSLPEVAAGIGLGIILLWIDWRVPPPSHRRLLMTLTLLAGLRLGAIPLHIEPELIFQAVGKSLGQQ